MVKTISEGPLVHNGYLLWGSNPPKLTEVQKGNLDEMMIPMMLNARPEA